MDPDTSALLRQIGRKIAELREAKRLTQEDLAAKLEHSLKYQQRIEAGRHNLSVGSLVKIAKSLRVAVPVLLAPPKSMTVNTGRPKKRGGVKAVGR